MQIIIIPVSALNFTGMYAACILRQAVIIFHDACKGYYMHGCITICNHLLLAYARQGTAGRTVQAIILSTSTG